MDDISVTIAITIRYDILDLEKFTTNLYLPAATQGFVEFRTHHTCMILCKVLITIALLLS